MEKILAYEGKDIRFKSTASLALRYKAQFGRDLYADCSEIQKSWNGPNIDISYEDIKAGNISEETLELLKTGTLNTKTLDLELVYNVIWAMAKCADDSIAPPIQWYDQFENGAPIFQWFGELSGMLMASMTGTQKN